MRPGDSDLDRKVLIAPPTVALCFQKCCLGLGYSTLLQRLFPFCFFIQYCFLVWTGSVIHDELSEWIQEPVPRRRWSSPAHSVMLVVFLGSCPPSVALHGAESAGGKGSIWLCWWFILWPRDNQVSAPQRKHEGLYLGPHCFPFPQPRVKLMKKKWQHPRGRRTSVEWRLGFL